MKKIVMLLIAVLLAGIPALTFATLKTFIKEYTYHASEVKDFQLTKDQITTLTAGIVQTEIVEEKLDGCTYWLNAKIAADSEQVVRAIDTLRKELAKAKGQDRQEKVSVYAQTVKELTAEEWFEKGVSFSMSGSHQDAIDAYSKTVELNPKLAEAYNNRGVAYESLGNYNQAIRDFDRAIELNPKDAGAYNNRGNVFDSLGNYYQAIRDFDKTIELNPKDGIAYYNRGKAYGSYGNFHQAIADMKIAAGLGHKGAQNFLRGKGISW